MKKSLRPANPALPQGGIVLPVVMIILAVMMLLGVTVIRNITLEERMAGNTRDQQIAFQAAEDALRHCEIETLKGGVRFFDTQADTYVGIGRTDPKNWEQAAKWQDASFSVEVPLKDSGVTNMWAARSRCMVEKLLIFSEIPGQLPVQAFRITARGVGRNADTVVMLQTYFRP